MEQCPLCKSYSVVYEEYYKRRMCLKTMCGWSEPSSIHNLVMTKAEFNKFEKEITKGSVLCRASITVDEPLSICCPSIPQKALTCIVNEVKK